MSGELFPQLFFRPAISASDLLSFSVCIVCIYLGADPFLRLIFGEPSSCRSLLISQAIESSDQAIYSDRAINHSENEVSIGVIALATLELSALVCPNPEMKKGGKENCIIFEACKGMEALLFQCFVR
ncbi:uncharacterized protein LOC127797606 [Diospyros lotus]|uniref:uncharacterized protein LOC127797606 n=1 Tax=Diospyros lotus TaxID=55363 RepID=UPI002256C7D5|nr:uncharacterized protein LOC127797606 [Diospyros lotus]